ncbi:hypothetical protein [Micromonospora sp. CNB394]|uniref:hypothetical protein n=1 Tax=Micromonospora sp. CNB394 TaxID=1169151 RepID=UPI001E4E58F9|nr:hypothetical protein [Micromonospora sp. CNB394]
MTVLIGRLPLEGLDDHLIDPVVSDPKRRPGPRLVDETFQPAREKPATPLAHHVPRHPKPLRDDYLLGDLAVLRNRLIPKLFKRPQNEPRRRFEAEPTLAPRQPQYQWGRFLTCR